MAVTLLLVSHLPDNGETTSAGQVKSLDEVIAAKPTAAYDADWNTLFSSDVFTSLAYRGV